ncbi:restriction endonuclease subunit S [Rhizobium sp. Z1P35]
MLERPISKPGSTRVAFGDVVRLSKARVVDPEVAGIERVVGLEHIEPGNLRIRRWGNVAEGTTFTTLFKPGQVLFGKRRAYQRKVAVADFEGVCSGDIYVLEPANDRLMPELLPFLCQTDAFFDHAVGTSAGSLSPRTNWTSLAGFEFMLPPIQEQVRLVEALVSIETAIAANQILRGSAWTANLANYDDVVGREVSLFHPDQDFRRKGDGLWEVVPLREAVSISNNLRKPLSSEIRETMRGDYPYYGATGEIDRIKEYRLEGLFSLIGEDGDHFLKYRIQPMTQRVSGKFNVNNHAHVISGTERCLTDWFDRYYRYRNVRVWLTKQGASRLKLKKDTLVDMPIALPSIDEQRQLIERLEATEESVRKIDARLLHLSVIKSNMLSNIV